MRKRGNNKIFYGWYITVATWFTYIALTSVTTYSGAVVNTHLIVDRGWNEGIVGIVNACLYASIAVFSVPAGMIAKKHGCRLAYIIAAIAGGSIFLTMFLTNGPMPVYIAGYLLVGISIALGGQVTAPILIDCWFERRKSVAMAIVMTAGGIGGFILSPIAEAVYSGFGIRGCWLYMGLAELAALIPSVFVYRDHPEEIGEVKDGLEWTKEHPLTKAERKAGQADLHRYESLKEAYRDRVFLLICVMNTVFRIVQTTFIAYALIHMMRAELPTSIGVTVISASNIMSLIGRFLVSLTGRTKIRYKTWTLLQYILLGCGMGMFAVSGSYALFMTAGLLIGFSTGFLTTLIPLLLTEQCGEQYYSEQYGMLNTISFTCMIFAPLIVSGAAASLGAYIVPFLSLTVLSILSGICTRGLA